MVWVTSADYTLQKKIRQRNQIKWTKESKYTFHFLFSMFTLIVAGTWNSWLYSNERERFFNIFNKTYNFCRVCLAFWFEFQKIFWAFVFLHIKFTRMNLHFYSVCSACTHSIGRFVNFCHKCQFNSCECYTQTQMNETFVDDAKFYEFDSVLVVSCQVWTDTAAIVIAAAAATAIATIINFNKFHKNDETFKSKHKIRSKNNEGQRCFASAWFACWFVVK